MFFGRAEQLGELAELWEKDTPSLVSCQGRRRIGKSRLIEEFASRSGAHFIVAICKSWMLTSSFQ